MLWAPNHQRLTWQSNNIISSGKVVATHVMKYRKGSSIATLTPWKVIPLFGQDDADNHATILSELPRAPPCSVGHPTRIAQTENGASSEVLLRQLIHKHVQDGSEASSVVVGSLVSVAWYLMQQGDDDDDKGRPLLESFQGEEPDEENDDDDDEPFGQVPLVIQVWEKFARERIQWKLWLRLLTKLARSTRFIEQVDPLLKYATNQVPHLNDTELQTVCHILQLPVGNRVKSSLVVQKLIRDRLEGQPQRLIAVLFSTLLHSDDSAEVGLFPLSCLPTAQLELTDNGQVVVTALYDIEDDNDIEICLLRDNTGYSVEERDSALRMMVGHSCRCLRCRYEIANGNDQVVSTLQEATRLARYFMSVGDSTRAKHLYKLALQKSTLNNLIAIDLRHALGAIELSNKNFLAAQRIWKQASIDYPGAKHGEIAVQLEKIEAYQYFIKSHSIEGNPPEQSHTVELKSPVPGAFVTRVIDVSTCKQVIDWAEKLGEWTQQRHYAVPTHDVPVHTIPELLKWFQDEFMTNIMQGVLARQFQKKRGCFYVHDAFCVRYTSGSSSNHLPIRKLCDILLPAWSNLARAPLILHFCNLVHCLTKQDTDESTHSFVLALNDDYDGGGTYFYDHDKTVRPPAGCTLSFCGGETLHGGEAVTRGVRYILAVFLYYDEDSETVPASQPSKRDATRSGVMNIFRESKLKKSEGTFSFGFAID